MSKMDPRQLEGSDQPPIMVAIASTEQVPYASLAYQPGPVTGSPNLVTIAQHMVGAAHPVQPTGAQSVYQPGLATGSPNLVTIAPPVVGAAHLVQPTGAPSAYLPGPATGSPNLATIAHPVVGTAHPVQATGATSAYQPGNVTGSSNLVTIAQPVVGAVHPVQPTGAQFAHYQLCQQYQQQQWQLHQQLQAFWAKQREECERVTDFRNHGVPLARIKRIMKADEDVKMIAAEAPILFARACEMFILELTKRAWNHVEENNRRTLQKNDVFAAITRTDLFDFLADVIPREDSNGLVMTGMPGDLIPIGVPLTAIPPTVLPSPHMPLVRAPSMYAAAPMVGPSRLLPASPVHVAQVPVSDKVEDQRPSSESEHDDFLTDCSGEPEEWK